MSVMNGSLFVCYGCTLGLAVGCYLTVFSLGLGYYLRMLGWGGSCMLLFVVPVDIDVIYCQFRDIVLVCYCRSCWCVAGLCDHAQNLSDLTIIASATNTANILCNIIYLYK